MEKELLPVLSLRAAIHQRGKPYPEIEFDQEAAKYGKMYTKYACFTNEEIKAKLDEHYSKNPKATECTYFWYEIFKETNKKENV